MIIIDKDKLLKDGVRSPADGSVYSNRREWNEHLKSKGLVEVGNDYNGQKPRELQGDYNCRKALTEATREVLSKRNDR